MTLSSLPRVDPARAIALALTLADKDRQGRVFSDGSDEVKAVLLAIRLAGWEIVARTTA
jgi:hypothetical protein